MVITFLGNFNVSYTSETHHVNTLESLGHTVIRMQEGRVDTEQILRQGRVSDLFVWVHTHGWKQPSRANLSMIDVLKDLKTFSVTTMTYHLDLWFGLDRQKDLEQDEFYKHIQHFFTVDKLMADWFNDFTQVKGHYLQAGVYEPECYTYETAKTKDIIFVGSKNYHKEWKYRPQLINWLESEYKQRFEHYGGDGLGVVRGEALNELYGSSKIVIGDSLVLNFDYPYYWSDRVYETIGRGGFIIHPYIKGMEEHFEDGKHLAFYEYGNFEELRYKIDYYLEHDTEREAIRKAGHEHVKANHTYTNRWQTIIKELGL